MVKAMDLHPMNLGSTPAGGDRKGIQPKMLPFTIKSPAYLGKHIKALE